MNNNTPKTLQELFDHPARWIKEALSGRRTGWGFVKVGTPYKDSTCFCLIGGFVATYGERLDDPEREEKWSRLRETVKSLYHKDVVSFNNHPATAFADIRKVIEHANV